MRFWHCVRTGTEKWRLDLFRLAADGVPVRRVLKGIWKPRVLNLPLSITTAPVMANQPRPYDDGFEANGLFRYRYREENPNHPDNSGLREIMLRRMPPVMSAKGSHDGPCG